ncbi:MAG: aldehyde dehydrogenase family protein [Halobacteriota archaeon]
MSQYTDTIQQNHETAIENATANVEFDAWVDGAPAVATTGERFETRDPVVDSVITTVPRCDGDDVDAAVDAASDALTREWGATTAAERSDAILSWVDRLREHEPELALLESLDAGKPLGDAAYEVDKALEYIAYYAHVVRGDQGTQIPFAEDAHAYTASAPYGVAGLIVPWNYPLILASWKLGPALAAGNTVVLKPAEGTPLSATRIAQLSDGILPDGVLNVVHGFGDEVGAPLTSHAGVDKLSFTGEDATGELVMKAAAEHVTPVTLELGGKSPFVVFPDADLEEAAQTAASGIFYNAGQSCDAFSRTLVHESIHDDFLDLFVDAAADLVVGDTLAEDTTMGPLASQQQFDKVLSYVDIGTESGATLAHGGRALDGEEYGDGWFVEPTIFTAVDNDSRLAQEEIFGPVAAVVTFESYEEAIELANDVEYGLAAGVATTNLSLAHRAAADIEAGSVWVNQYGRIVPGTPFGGFKRSGIGRECARETLEQYRQRKTVNIALDEPSL